MYGSKEVGKVGQKEGRNQARKQARKQRSAGRVTAMPKRHRRRAKGGCLSWAFLFPTGFYFICTGYIPSIKSCCMLRFPLAEKLNKLAQRNGKFSSPKTFASGGVDVWVGRLGDRRRVVGEVFRTFSPDTCYSLALTSHLCSHADPLSRQYSQHQSPHDYHHNNHCYQTHNDLSTQFLHHLQPG